MERLTKELCGQMMEGNKLETEISQNLKELGYG